jgi:hypothetical protein
VNTQRKNRRYHILVPVLLILTVLLWWSLPQRGPTYAGKKIDYWFKEYRQPNPKGPEDASKAFREMGAAAVPFLVKRMSGWDGEQWYANHWLTLPAWMNNRLPRPKFSVPQRDSALTLLQMLGPAAKGSTTEIVRYYRKLSSHQPPNPAMNASISPRALYWIVPDYYARGTIMRLLGVIGEGNAEAGNLMVDALRDPIMSPYAITSLIQIANLDETVVPRMNKELNNPDVATRLGAVIVLGQLGPKAAIAIPKLKELVNPADESDPKLRYNAAEALWNIDRQAYAIFPFRMAELKSPDELVKWKAVSSLAQYGLQSKPAVAALMEMLGEDGNNRLRGEAAIALGRIGPDAKTAIPALKNALADQYSNVQEAAKEALLKIGPEL